jgi:membrane peptidoglycan carboxypeptidase
MYTGFGRSVNTYFIPLQQKVGSEKSVDAAKRMGIKFSAKGTKDAPSDYEFARDKRLAAGWGPFSLGVSAVTPLELASAYATIAANGMYCVPRPITRLTDRKGATVTVAAQCTQAVRKTVANKALDVARCPVGDQARYGQCDGGTAAYVHDVVQRPVAGKSGTTDSERTATFVAMTPQMAVAGMLVDTDNPLNTGHKMKHPPINYAVTYTLRDGVANKPVKDFP